MLQSSAELETLPTNRNRKYIYLYERKHREEEKMPSTPTFVHNALANGEKATTTTTKYENIEKGSKTESRLVKMRKRMEKQMCSNNSHYIHNSQMIATVERAASTYTGTGAMLQYHSISFHVECRNAKKQTDILQPIQRISARAPNTGEKKIVRSYVYCVYFCHI